MKILVAEDDPVALGFLELSLGKWGYETEIVYDGAAALEMLRKPDAPKLAILDWMMPKMDGIDVCKEMRKSAEGEHGYTYIILLTIRSSLYDMVNGIAAGADDYIIKPFIPQDLKVRIDAGRRIVELQEKLIESKRALISSSANDLGTRTWNRSKIISLIEAELNRSKRKGRTQSLAIIKIDNYFDMLAEIGPKNLDEFLCNAMNRIQKTVRSYDSIGRYSDDEFLILFPETVSSEMPTIVDRVFNTINEISFPHPEGKFPLSVTIGVVTCKGDIAEEKLISEANAALIQAPNNGSNRAYFSVIQ
ncbi:putative transcriptional regulator ycf27 [Geobacter sp. OR-1]|uniref:GGDEF domain-containing response regulator n=1 Tax=Geobacter sp. OR-1 TaxID=1266765 RepID=UPI00054368C7|nr:response regulator [Geobacter sp. OR-1]GAM08122.1 putative transcriptional regulator ycf27 [Geobacter sp. OR-1]